MYSGISIHSIPFNTDIWNRYKDRDTLYELANVVSNGNVSANSIIYLIYSHCAHRINLLVHNQHNNNLVISHASTHFKIIYRNFDQYRETGIIGLVDSKSVNLEKMEKDSIIKHMIQIYNTSQNQQFLFDVSRLPSNYAIGLGV
jgi:adenosine/AMP kinase